MSYLAEKNKLTEQNEAEIKLQELNSRRKQLSQECSFHHKTLDEEYEAFYDEHPEYKPKPRAKSEISEEDCEYDEGRFSSCKRIIYEYENKDRKIVTWERVPRKTSGMADCSCCL